MTERIQLCGEVPEPKQWPMMSMKVYGTIPGREEPLFRIVFASSVKHLVGGDFADGFTGYRVVPTYEYIGDKWILEKWVSGYDFTKQTEIEYKAQWEDPTTHLCITGPYPRLGAYQWVWTFNKPEQIGAAGIVAALVNKAKYNNKAANRQALEEGRKLAKKKQFQQNFDKMHDAQRAFGIRAANIGGRVKATKSAPPLMDARKLGLPVRGGGTRVNPNAEQLEVAGY